MSNGERFSPAALDALWVLIEGWRAVARGDHHYMATATRRACADDLVRLLRDQGEAVCWSCGERADTESGGRARRVGGQWQDYCADCDPHE